MLKYLDIFLVLVGLGLLFLFICFSCGFVLFSCFFVWLGGFAIGAFPVIFCTWATPNTILSFLIHALVTNLKAMRIRRKKEYELYVCNAEHWST